ncbi:LOW QUALITY PROTEIN: sialate O-acetylesterase-like [Liolophura sinensis]|uniref:LOW QUALITY PROTEIN: sialate O-acetylesterase-like n=1 Tax=Liolophura sinensis TaxID=3198878 RepID=UPI003159116D
MADKDMGLSLEITSLNDYFLTSGSIHIDSDERKQMTDKLLVYVPVLSDAATLGKEGSFAFASYYGDHMVLQRGPQRANIWGYSPHLGEKVTVTVGGHSVSTTVVSGHVAKGGVWQVKLQAMTNPGPYVITASSNSGRIQLHDVLFGDVWICSGQSNMQVSVSQVFNAAHEIEDSNNYPNIRVMTIRNQASTHAETDLLSIWKHWSPANKGSIGGPNWNYFSAVCWFYGKYLYRHRGYPIGLIASDWGAARIEPWMSPQALSTCHVNVPSPLLLPHHEPGKFYVPNVPTVMWNSMMGPLTKMTIYGAVWYQGESNDHDPSGYKCLFPAMIADWRKQFHQASGGETNAMFPFGFVQLAALSKTHNIGDFPDLRWAQTVNLGYAPNSVLKKVFMAVAMDLPDYNSPWGAIHPRYKQDVGLRLGLAAEAVAYGVENVHYQGPFPTSVTAHKNSGTLTIEFDHGRTPIEVRSNDGYEVCCSTNVHAHCSTKDSNWKAAPISAHSTSSINLNYHQHCGGNAHVLGVRYAWRESPCDVKKCAVYSKANGLPAPPYLSLGSFALTSYYGDHMVLQSGPQWVNISRVLAAPG